MSQTQHTSTNNQQLNPAASDSQQISDPQLAARVTIIRALLEEQLTDPDGITMPNGTTLAYRFHLTPVQAESLLLPSHISRIEIQFDLMMEGMDVIGLDEQGLHIASGDFPFEAKKYFIPQIFALYGKKDTAPGEQKADRTGDAAAIDGESSLKSFVKNDCTKTIRRFDLNFQAKDKKGSPLHLFIEIEQDSDDDSYLNYWIGCEEHTVKHYIASCQGDLSDDNLMEIVKVKNLYFFLEELNK